MIGAGVVTAPGIFIPKFEPVIWKVVREPRVFFYDMPPVYDERILDEWTPIPLHQWVWHPGEFHGYWEFKLGGT